MTPVTCKTLEPLLRETFTDGDAALRALVLGRPTWERPIYRYARRFDVSAAEEIVNDALVRTVTKAESHRGLSRPRDCATQSPSFWLIRVLKNHITDRHRAQRRQGDAQVLVDPEDLVDPAANAEQRTQAEANYRRLLARLEQVEGPPTRLLAALCLYAPQAVGPDHVNAAAAARSGASEGLARPADVTWTLLQAWLADYADVSERNDARLELAWILRSNHPGPATAWKVEDPVAADRALDLVRKWAARLLLQVRAAEVP
jgi:DNA-directed RNA polymerase specialized sigma24 family protein